jgi:hypothetical protein
MKTMPETTAADPDVDSEFVPSVPDCDRSRRPRLILAAVLSVVPAVVATTLGIVLRRRRAAAGGTAAPVATRPAPSSTINVNWGFALFGTNVMGERGRRPGWLRGRLSRRR